jgi:protocatechuate 3,4-dioxygenase beta subunit
LLTLALLAAAGVPPGAAAQLPAGRPAPPPPPTSPGPVRDPGGRPAPSATAVGKGALAGRVTIASGQPAVGARVMLNGGAGESRMTMTDNDGRFVFEGLRTGRYNVMVSKAGYVQISYGQRRVNSPGTQIPLADGERRQIEILLPRGAVITGMVLDERGEPVISAQVRAVRYTMASGRRRGQQMGGGSTDDRGIYRLHSLQPGEYGICAIAQNRGPINDTQRIQMEVDMLRRSLESAPSPGARQQMLERLARVQAQRVEHTEPAMGYAPSCFPASSPSPSTTLVVAAGEERTGIDIQLALTPVARIGGTIIAPGGTPLRNLQTMLVNADDTLSDLERQGGNVTPDGHFFFQNVAPGRYTITVRSMQMGPSPPPGGAAARPPEDPPLWGSAEVVVAGQDVSDVVIELQRGITVSGQLAVQPTTLTPPADLSGAQVSLFLFAPDQNGFMFMGPPPQGKVDASGKFTISHVMPGRYRFSASISGQGWVLDSVTAGAQDVLDFPLEVKAGRDVSGVTVTFGDRVTELSGTVADSKGQPATEQTLLLYTTDQRFWTPQSRRIRIARAGDDGHYVFRNVPPGEYRLTTLVDPEAGTWYDRELLEQLDSTSVRIVLAEGEKKVEHVKIR